jgi:hypothetical protein
VAERLTSRKIDLDIDGALHLDCSGGQFKLIFSGQRLDVDGSSVLAIWRLLGDLGKLGEIASESGFRSLAPFEVILKVRNEKIGSSSFSFGEQLSTIAKLGRFRPDLANMVNVLIRDMLRALKRFTRRIIEMKSSDANASDDRQ